MRSLALGVGYDTNQEAGPFFKALLDISAGVDLVGAGSLISWADWCSIWCQFNGVECTYERQNRQAFEEVAGPVGREVAEMYQFFEQYGYCGVDQKDVVYPGDLSVQVHYTTMEEYMQSQDWSSILHPENNIVEAS